VSGSKLLDLIDTLEDPKYNIARNFLNNLEKRKSFYIYNIFNILLSIFKIWYNFKNILNLFHLFQKCYKYFRFFFILFFMNNDKKCMIRPKTKLINFSSRNFFFQL